MKKIFIFIMLVLLIACNEEIVEVQPTIAKLVQVQEMTVESYRDYEIYVGYVKSAGTVKHAFEVEGRIESILVAIGDYVDKDQLLATVDTEGYQYALDAARAELSSAQSQYMKAVESLTYTDDLFKDIEKLYKEGVSTKSEYDRVKLNVDIATSDVNSARGLVNQAKTQVDVNEYLYEQTDLLASKSGIVVDVLNETGELVAAGYPVLVLRDELPVVSFGVSQEDLKYLEVDSFLEMRCDEKELSGRILSVNQVPDSTTQTYEIEATLEENLPLGAIVSVTIPTEKIKGVKVPLNAIRSDGEDFVYAVEENHVVRKNISVLAIFNQEVIVSGLESNTQLIIEGIMGLSPGDEVKVVGDES